MKFLISLSLIIFFCNANAWAQKQSADAADAATASLESVIANENNFARAAGDKGIKAAFLQFAAKNAVMIDPVPINAREMWEKKNESTAFLTWRPTWAEVSATGELAFTTGPWELSSKGKTEAPSAFGEFATVWKKQSDKTWKFVFDFGVDHAKPEGGESASAATNLVRKNKAENKNSQETSDWRALENDFASLNEQKGVLKAYENFLSNQTRLLRQNHFPFVGKKSALEILKVENGNLKTRALNGETNADLAYAYGEYELAPASGKTEKGHFLRMWKREPKGWRIILDLMRPLAPAQ